MRSVYHRIHVEIKKEDPTMKKLVALLLAAMMLCASVLAVAEAPEGYPEVVEGIDFGGRTVKIYTWYSMDRSENPTEEEQALYDYRDWLMETYNCTIEYEVPYDWAGSIDYLTNFVTTADSSQLAIFTMPMDFIGPAVKNNLLMPLNDLLDVTDEKWNAGTTEFMTSNGNVTALWNGASEPRECVFFNITALKDANINPDDIYDMQANGTWTWDAMLDLFAKVQKDVDGDGVVDVWASTGSGDDLLLAAIYSNNGSIYKYEDGQLKVGLGSENTIEALSFVQKIRNEYFRKAMTDAEGNQEQWDYYKQAFVQGEGVFRFGQTWEGFNGNEAMNTDGFEWGCVAFPTGPKAEAGAYKSIVNDNLMCIPNVYSAEDAKLLGFVLDAWHNPTPGYEDDTEGWIGNKYNYTDDRAVDETYAMLREGKAGRDNKVVYLGTQNDILGASLLWGLAGGDVASLIEAGMPAWQAACDTFNAK